MNNSKVNDVIAVIPARGGSKGIPKKNRRMFLGKPLVQWTIDSAIKSKAFHRIILSTDDPFIQEIAIRSGIESPFLRPHNLSGDTTSTADVVRHACAWLAENWNDRPDKVIILEPTSPGRQPFHIMRAINILSSNAVDSVASVTTVPHHFACPKQLNVEDDGMVRGVDGTHPGKMIHRRQDMPITYAFDGTVFACTMAVLKKNPPTIWGDRVKSFIVEWKYSVDLDHEDDWVPAEEKLRSFLD